MTKVVDFLIKFVPLKWFLPNYMRIFMKYYLCFILATTGFGVFGQGSNFNSQRNWSRNKKELVFNAGVTQFLGDLGGKNKIGKDYSLADIDIPSTGVNFGVGYRFRFKPHFATTSLLNFGLLRGDDNNTTEIARSNRNLHFRSQIITFHQRFEWIVFANEKYGKRFSIAGAKGFKEHHEQFYVFSGIGVTYFNPQAEYNGSWENLRPLKTEGQGLAGGAKAYGPVTASIPFGVGFRMSLAGMWRIGIEATYFKTFTDYLDDVSTVYFDPAILAQEVSPLAAALSNPSTTHPEWYNPGSQRGDNNLDAYFYLNFTISKNITYRAMSNKGRIVKYKGGRAKF